MNMAPVWKCNGVVSGETLLFVKSDDDSVACADLMYPVKTLNAIYNSPNDKKFAEGKDFRFTPGERRVYLTEDSAIPYLTSSDLYPAPENAILFSPENENPNAIAGRLGVEGGLLLFNRRDYFARIQVEVDYVGVDCWQGITPAQNPEKLPRTRAKLASGSALKIATVGDSITDGHNSGKLEGFPPYRPPYIEQFAGNVSGFYDVDVKLLNKAVSGSGVADGLARVEDLKDFEPNLLVIAYGMNNIFGTPLDEFSAHTSRIMTRARELFPDIEFLLVSSMPGNPEWERTPAIRMELFRGVLTGLAESCVHISVADVTGVFNEMLKYKKYLDITGNGVNHPNDFAHAVYASVLSSVLFEMNDMADRPERLTLER